MAEYTPVLWNPPLPPFSSVSFPNSQHNFRIQLGLKCTTPDVPLGIVVIIRQFAGRTDRTIVYQVSVDGNVEEISCSVCEMFCIEHVHFKLQLRRTGAVL
jgi:hypothetical protein